MTSKTVESCQARMRFGPCSADLDRRFLAPCISFTRFRSLKIRNVLGPKYSASAISLRQGASKKKDKPNAELHRVRTAFQSC